MTSQKLAFLLLNFRMYSGWTEKCMVCIETFTYYVKHLCINKLSKTPFSMTMDTLTSGLCVCTACSLLNAFDWYVMMFIPQWKKEGINEWIRGCIHLSMTGILPLEDWLHWVWMFHGPARTVQWLLSDAFLQQMSQACSLTVTPLG